MIRSPIHSRRLASRAKTRHLATRIAPTVMPSFLAASAVECSDDAVSQNACQVAGWTSRRTCSAARLKQRPAQLLIELDGLRIQRQRQSCPASPAGPSRRSQLAPVALLQPIDDQIASHTPQPAAKRPAFLRRIPAVDAPADRQEQLLHRPRGHPHPAIRVAAAVDKPPAHREIRTPPRPRDLANHAGEATGWHGW